MKTTIRSLFSVLAFSSLLTIAPNAQAIVPPPDGGYPGGNTAEGQNALLNLTSGSYNTAVGFQSLGSDTTGGFNTATGAGTMLFNTADENTAFGAAALLFNNTGFRNTAIGVTALLNNDNGVGNTAIGHQALFANQSDFNTACGSQALASNTTGVANTAGGAQALFSNTTGEHNTATGVLALFGNTVGNNNTANGYSALNDNTIGDNNTANGAEALAHNTEGRYNTAAGVSALSSNVDGIANTAIGFEALSGSTKASGNTAIGYQSLMNNAAGGNTAVGASALISSTGFRNTALGGLAGSNLTTGSGNVCIGDNVFGQSSESDTTRIRNIGSTPIVGGVNVVIDGTGGNGDQILGYAPSSRRYKEDIQPMDKASKTLFALKPVTFRAKGKTDPAQVTHYGLIAEDVAAVDSDLVVYNAEGKPETLRLNSINAMLLNEFLKEHKKVEKLEATVADLVAELQKVKAQVQTSSPILRVAVQNP